MAGGPAAAETPDTRRTVLRIERECAAARTRQGDPELYRLDWCDDWSAARTRAASERRPLLMIVVNNISGGGDLKSGHC